MFKLTTKSIYSLEKGESTVLCCDDVEYKELPKLDCNKYEWFKDKTQAGRALVTRI